MVPFHLTRTQALLQRAGRRTDWFWWSVGQRGGRIDDERHQLRP